ncbi:hypothetical protein RND81_11G203800 [Saponaria officinalis]|uniref:Uncharacterized protein n=1 Tax=Saponaria officinalis TaxID=3572 RepID=A0AAW1HNP0_SAPOF
MSQRFKGDVDDIEEEEEEEDDYEKKKTKKRLLFGGCNYKRVKEVVFYPLKKVHRRFNHKNSVKRSSSNSVKSGKFYCSLCFSKPQTLENSIDEELNVNHQSIKGLIENNDFYCVECNTHFDD